MAKAVQLEKRKLRFLYDVRLAFFVKRSLESNIIDELQQILPEFCQLISQTTPENKWINFYEALSQMRKNSKLSLTG